MLTALYISHLLSVIQHQIHVLVESRDDALNPQVDVLVEPDLDPGLVLKKPEDQIDRLGHHLLDLLGRHLGSS